MPNWKKVIVSGSSATLTTVTATTGFTGSLSGSALSATTALSASTQLTTTNATHYLTFVDANNATPASEKFNTSANITFNPATGNLTLTGSLNGSGQASVANLVVGFNAGTPKYAAISVGASGDEVAFVATSEADTIAEYIENGWYSYGGFTQDGKLQISGSNVGIGKKPTGLATDARLQVSASADITGSLRVTAGITGSLLGTASLANTIHTARSATDAIFYPTLVDSNNIGVSPESVFTAGTLTYNPNNGSLNATSFTGSLRGNLAGTASLATNATTAATASKVTTGLVTTNAIHYMPFVDTNYGGAGVNFLGTIAGFNFNPNSVRLEITGSLFATSITGSLRGTASYATMASQSGYTMQFVLATTGSNLAASTTYRMGAPVRNQLNTTSGRTRIYVPRPGKVKYAHLYIRTNGTLASAGTSTLALNKNSSISESIATSTTAGSSADATVSSTAISMSVVQGDFLEINWITPAWGTLPTAVEASAIIYIENNI